MTARSLLAAAFGVLGTWWLAYFGYALVAWGVASDPRVAGSVEREEWGRFLGRWLPYLAFGIVLVVARRRLAARLVSMDSGPGPLPHRAALQRTALRCLAVSFVAAGLGGLAFVAVGEVGAADGTRPLAAVLVGALLLWTTPQLDAWLRRDQARADGEAAS
jgi:hypothetical protein